MNLSFRVKHSSQSYLENLCKQGVWVPSSYCDDEKNSSISQKQRTQVHSVIFLISMPPPNALYMVAIRTLSYLKYFSSLAVARDHKQADVISTNIYYYSNKNLWVSTLSVAKKGRDFTQACHLVIFLVLLIACRGAVVLRSLSCMWNRFCWPYQNWSWGFIAFVSWIPTVQLVGHSKVSRTARLSFYQNIWVNICKSATLSFEMLIIFRNILLRWLN